MLHRNAVVTVLSFLVKCFFMRAFLFSFLFLFNAALKALRIPLPRAFVVRSRPKQEVSPAEVHSAVHYRTQSTSFSELSVLSLKLGHKFWILQNYSSAQHQMCSLARFQSCHPNTSTFHLLTFNFSLSSLLERSLTTLQVTQAFFNYSGCRHRRIFPLLHQLSQLLGQQ